MLIRLGRAIQWSRPKVLPVYPGSRLVKIRMGSTSGEPITQWCKFPPVKSTQCILQSYNIVELWLEEGHP